MMKHREIAITSQPGKETAGGEDRLYSSVCPSKEKVEHSVDVGVFMSLCLNSLIFN